MSDPSPEGRFYRTRWGLLGEWYCVAVDLTDEEQEQMCVAVRDGAFGGDACPLEFIRDRLYGGFICAEEDRRHVYFATGEYSWIAANEGDFWANDNRAAQWRELLQGNGSWHGDGPFTEDFPKQEVA